MLIPIHNPATGKLRVIGYASGSGDTLWKAYEIQKEMEQTPQGCPFEIVGVFCSKAESKAQATAEKLGVPYVCIDIKEFYAKRDKPLKDREVRAEFDAAALEQLRPLNGDMILLAGYVWATTDCLLDEYLVVNVHPADLTIIKDGRRLYAGGNGVGAALDAKEPYVCATSHLATKQIDGGPMLFVSARVPVDYNLHSDETERMRHYLRLVNEQGRLVGARTVLELALGNFATDEAGTVYYMGKESSGGQRIENWEENKPMYQRRIDKLLYPDSVAVIGASQKPGIGNAIMQNIVNGGFTGAKYAVNVRSEDVLGAKGYASISEIPDNVDLAVIATPGKTVLQLAEECGKKGVHALVCISAGFKEVGGEGIAAQEKLIEIVNRYNMRLIGPNCMGEMNIKSKLNATILSGEIVKGNIAMVTQSGSIGAALLDYAEELGIGFSSLVSLGNQADINVCDLLPFYDEDEHTSIIVLYLESILDPVRFWKTASMIKKPIILLKSGNSAAGMAAASSHTGSLAGNDKVVNALIQKSGVVRVQSLEECFICASALAHMPRVQGNRVGLLTNAGGPGILIADALSQYNFDIPKASEQLQATLRAGLMAEATVQNPMDVVATAPPEHYVLAAQAMIDSGEYDSLLVCCVPPATVDTTKVAQALAPVLRDSKIPVLTNFFGPTMGKGAREVMLQNHIPTSQYPEQIATMLAGMREPVRNAGAETKRVPRAAVKNAEEILSTVASGDYLPAEPTFALLQGFGIHAAANALLKNAKQIKETALTFPAVAKIDHPDIVHKSDVGGVRLNIQAEQELEEVVNDFLTRFPGANGVFVQEMVPSGIELIIGSVRDDALGNSVMIGLGGLWVEVMKDVAFGYPPLTQEEAMALINSLRCEPLLAGYRGKEGVNKDVLAALLQKISAMLLALPNIGEIDLNPIIYNPAKDAFVAVDARIRKA